MFDYHNRIELLGIELSPQAKIVFSELIALR